MKLSALLLVKNEQEMLDDCLKSLDFADEIVVLDQNSHDKTVEIAAKYTKRIYQTSETNFAKNREYLLSLAKGDWIMYLDADERLTMETIEKIRKIIATDQDVSAFYSERKTTAFMPGVKRIASEDQDTTAFRPCVVYFPRKNYILGKWLRHGGWWPDFTPRLFRKNKLLGWEGAVHESPKIEGQALYLSSPIIHLSARSISQMFAKSINWAEVEANLYLTKGGTKVSEARIIKTMIVEFLRRYIFKLGILDGYVGLIEGVYQALHQAMVQTYLWEKQSTTSKKTSA